MTTILIKKRDTAGAPTAGDLTNAAGGVEIAINTATKRIYSKDSGGNIIELGTNATSSTIDQLTVTTSTTLSYGTANQVQFLNGSKQLVGDSDLTFDGTTLSATNISSSGSVTLSGGTANGVTYLNGSKVLTSGSALTFDGTSNFKLNSTTTNAEIRATASGGAAASVYSDNSSVWFGSVNAYPVIFSYNNAEQMRLTSTGLGIGTSSPGASYKLDVNGYARIRFGLIGQTTLAMYGDSSSSSGMTLDSSGNLGLGVTPSAWGGGNTVFQTNGGSLYTGNANNFRMVSNAYASSTGFKYVNNGYATYYSQNDGQGSHIWQVAPSGTAGNAISFTQAMTLDASGNLALGRTAATAYGTTTFSIDSAAGTSYFDMYNAGARKGYLYAGSSSFNISTTTSVPLVFETNGSERMRIDSSGNVGIGTGSPSTLLHLSASNPTLRIDGQSYGNSGAKLQFIGWANSTNNWQLDVASIGGAGLEFVPSTTAGGTTFTTPAFTMYANGVLSVTSGVQFPATQSASSDANTLDDYEEGTWTPDLRFGGGTTGITYGDISGTYTKIGRQVTARFYFRLTSKGSSTGQAIVFGLPFTNSSNGWSPPSIWFYNGGLATIKGYVEQNSQYIVFNKDLTSVVTDADFNNFTELMLVATYFV